MRLFPFWRMVFTIWIVVTVIFFTLRILPGDAIRTRIILGGGTYEDIEAQRYLLGLNRPIPRQYVDYLIELAKGKLGVSLSSGLPVSGMIAEQLRYTLPLVMGAITLATIIGTGIGAIGALCENRVIRSIASLLITFTLSTPLYLTAPVVITVMAIQLKWFPATGTGDFRHLILPTTILGFHLSGSIGRLTMKSLHETKQAEFVRFAKARGLPNHLIIRRYILRIGLLPILPVVGLQLGFVLSGTVITESIFARPGIGRLLLNAVITQDYPVIQGIVMLSAIFFGVIRMIVDLIQSLVDPRLQ